MPAPTRTERPAPLVDIAIVPLIIAGALVWWLPAATTGTSATRAFAAIGIGALVALAFARDPFASRPLVRRLVWLVAALAGWYIATRMWAWLPGGSMREGARLAGFALVVYAGHVSLVRASSRALVLVLIAAAAAVIAAPELWDVLRHGAPDDRQHGYLDYWNASAIVALTTVPLAALLLRSRRMQLALLAAPLLCLAVSSAVSTASRGALASTLVALIVAVLLDPQRRLAVGAALATGVVFGLGVLLLTITNLPGWVVLGGVVVLTFNAALAFRHLGLGPIALDAAPAEQPRTRMRVLGAGICAVLAAIVIGLALSSGGDGASSALDRSASGSVAPEATRLASTDDGVRSEWWRMAVEQWVQQPIIGRGGEAFESYGTWRAGPTAEHVHSSPLQVLLDTGIIGLVLGAAALGALTLAVLRASRTPERAAAAGIVAMVLAQSLLDWTLSLPQVLFVLALAVIVALPRSPSAHDAVPLAPIKSLVGMMSVIAALTVISIIPFAGDLFTDQSAESFDAGRYTEAADSAHRSMQLMPSLDALQIEAAALEAQGKISQARERVIDSEAVWARDPDGLAFAQARLGMDPTWARRIEQKLATFAERDPLR